MRFWDSSAIVPLLADEPRSLAMLTELERDRDILVWWATALECMSALARRRREGSLDSPTMAEAVRRLTAIADGWIEVDPVSRIRQTAIRLVRVHPLRAADALQLAAALIAADDQPTTLPLVTLDDRLAEAAEREGFAVVRPTAI